MTAPRHFASDNCAGAHPEVIRAIAEANVGHAPSYGADRWTARAVELFRAELGPEAEVYPVFGGTGANVVALSALLRPWEAVICPEGAHICVDECGAPERFIGVKLIGVPTADGKLRPADVEQAIRGIGDEHRVQPRVVSVSQATELGTVYTPGELRALADAAHAHGLLIHVDGARLANAAASLGVPLRALTTDAGIDALSFGGTKNGLLGAEAVVFLGQRAVPEPRYLRKQAMQLASKMRFLSAQFIALLEDGLWQRSAVRANAMACRLRDGLKNHPRIRITQPVESNAVFAIVPPEYIPPLQDRFGFLVWNERTSEVRWMCSWDTTEGDVDGLLGAIREIVK
jgi:threonine aldolase